MDNKKITSHRSLYKSPRGNGLPWKDVYRKRCLERFRSSRDDYLEHFRSSCGNGKSLFLSTKEEIKKFSSPGKIVQDIMEEEWSAIYKNRSFPSLNKNANFYFSSGEEDNDDEIARELCDIQNELVSEEEAFFNEFLNFEAAALQSQIAMFHEIEVICPICKIKKLKESSYTQPSLFSSNSFQTPPKVFMKQGTVMTILKCDCGVELSRNNISLTMVQSALQNTINTHELKCVSPLTFSPSKDICGSNILVECPSCDWITYLL